jgi:predicted Co/Zn/Cd cation transporter (cation efflux family)
VSTSDKWEKERNAAKAVQVAFDLGHEVSFQIRSEALQRGLNPPDRIREILGLPVSNKPVRPRLSISLTDRDFELLAAAFGVDVSDRLKTS